MATTQKKITDHYDQYPFYLNDEVIISKIASDTPLGKFICSLDQTTDFYKIVDLGCGALAKNISLLKNSGAHLTKNAIIGTDISSQSLSLAKQYHPDIQFIRADHNTLPFKTHCFDLVIATGTIHLMHNPNAGILEISRILKTDKFLFLSVYNKNCLYSTIYRLSGFLRSMKKLGFEKVIKFIFIPLYSIIYRIANVVFTKKKRNIPCREIEMDFFDKFMVPIAHFYTEPEIRDLLQNDFEILSSDTYAWGMMIGILAKKKNHGGDQRGNSGMTTS